MTTLTRFSAFLGKYYPELLYSASQEKYKNSFLDCIFDQRFAHQPNDVQMVFDPSLEGLSMVVMGNEIHVSNDLLHHDTVEIIHSVDIQQISNPKSLYNPENFGSLAYLVCPNQVTLKIPKSLTQPIYVKYRGDYESFHHSVLFFYLAEGVDVEIVEEIESLCALNAVNNYVVSTGSSLRLTTFYQNRISASSIVYRSVVTQEFSEFTHNLLGRASSGVLDETKIHPYANSRNYFNGIVDAPKGKFHSIVYVEPIDHNYRISVDYRNIPRKDSKVSFYPVIVGQEPNHNGAKISVQDLEIDRIPAEELEDEISKFISDIWSVVESKNISGIERFYKNKSEFTLFHK